MAGGLTTRRLALAVAVPALLGALQVFADVDSELRGLARQHGLAGDPTAGMELPSIDDPLPRLGKLLFFSKALSGDLDVACASCHHPLTAGADGLSLSVGVGALDPDRVGPGRVHDATGRGRDDPDADGGPNVPRNAPTTFNVAMYSRVLFHDGRVERLADGGIVSPDSLLRVADPDAGSNLVEAQARFPTISEDEMLGFRFGQRRPGREIFAHLQARIGDYGIGEGAFERNDWLAEFRKSFAAPGASAEELVTFANIIKAMGEYQRSQVFVDTPWRAYLRGDSQALSAAAKRGALKFYRDPDAGGAGCARCHRGDFFTDERFHVLAIPQLGRGKNNGPYRDHDNGRYKLSRRLEDKYAFRTPSLLNVSLTAPYGHSGAYATLAAVVRHHLDPRTAVAGYDFSLAHLAQFRELRVSYPRARENTEAALATVALGNDESATEFDEGDIADIVAFLEHLADPCAADAGCVAPWLPGDDDPDPDGLRLRANFRTGHGADD